MLISYLDSIIFYFNFSITFSAGKESSKSAEASVSASPVHRRPRYSKHICKNDGKTRVDVPETSSDEGDYELYNVMPCKLPWCSD